jgi:hypothetical protein
MMAWGVHNLQQQPLFGINDLPVSHLLFSSRSSRPRASKLLASAREQRLSNSLLVAGPSAQKVRVLLVPWPPRVGDPLPRAADVWYQPAKFDDWVLAPRGHGLEWQRVFHVTRKDVDEVWGAIEIAIRRARIIEVRSNPDGITCGVDVLVTLNGRAAMVRASWHYADADAKPRLVSAYIRS